MSEKTWQARGAKGRPAELEHALQSADAIRILPAHVREQALERLIDLKRRLHGLVCSQPWFDHCWQTGEPFPPAAMSTPMVACRCDKCRRDGRVWPAGYAAPEAGPTNDRAPGHFASVLSYECYLESLSDWEAAHIPSSPSGIALRAIREGRIRVRFRGPRKRHR